MFTYQGDGDLAAIGTAETVHAATRGENITVIFINNTTYGMTGGQMAPTTLPGQVTQTTPYGRNPDVEGFPVRVCEMVSTLSGVALAERVTVTDPANIRKAKAAIRKGFEFQKNKQGFSLIEVLSTRGSCLPTSDYTRTSMCHGCRPTARKCAAVLQTAPSASATSR